MISAQSIGLFYFVSKSRQNIAEDIEIEIYKRLLSKDVVINSLKIESHKYSLEYEKYGIINLM